jgi:exosortase
LTLAGLLPAWLAMAWLVSKAQWYWQHRADLQFGWIVLLLCGYLFWESWEVRPAARFRWNFLSAGLAVVGFLLLFWVQIYRAAFGTMAALVWGLAIGAWLVIFANLGYVFGCGGIRHFAFAFLFIALALPLPSILQGPIVNGLQRQVAAINVEVLNAMGIPAQQVGSLIHLPNGTVGIDEACSGVRSLQSSVMATLFIGYLTLKRFSLRVILLASGIALALLGNITRSIYLSYTASAKGIPSINAVHDTAGWSILVFTVAGVALFSWLLARFERKVHRALAAPDGVRPSQASRRR